MVEALAYVGAGLVGLWGAAHLARTAQIVEGFGEIGEDNRRIILMEWVAEGLTMLLLAGLVLAVTTTAGAEDQTAALVYRIVAGGLVVFGGWTAATAARNDVIWFKACPFVLGATAPLLIVASVV